MKNYFNKSMQPEPITEAWKQIRVSHPLEEHVQSEIQGVLAYSEAVNVKKILVGLTAKDDACIRNGCSS